MTALLKRSTVYFEPEIHQALKIKSVINNQSVSTIVNEAIRGVLQEDQEDLSVFEERINEPTISYEALLADLESHGKL